ncbi:MAG: TIGR00266 family protein [Alkalispirochaeta sp.]
MDREKTDYPYTISGAPDYGMFNITIPQGHTLRVEHGAMAYMDPSLTMHTKIGGALGRVLSGEGLFINEFTAAHRDAEIGIAPPIPGDVDHVYLESDGIFLQSSAFVAAAPDISIDAQFEGFRGFFSGEGFFLMRCSGTGDLWFNTFGGMIEIPVTGNYVVDTGHIVAFTDTLSYEVHPVGGLKSLFLSGEGLVSRFSGTGTIWIQTKKSPAFVRWAHSYRRVQSKKDK